MASKPKESTVSEIRTPRAPHPMDATPKVEAKPKVERKPISASKASKTVKVAKRAPVPTHRTPKGDPTRCMVMVNATTQCANPGRHPHGKGWTCSTHDRAILAGKTVRIAGKANLVYVAPHAPVATA